VSTYSMRSLKTPRMGASCLSRRSICLAIMRFSIDFQKPMVIALCVLINCFKRVASILARAASSRRVPSAFTISVSLTITDCPYVSSRRSQIEQVLTLRALPPNLFVSSRRWESSPLSILS
jgi:hypothetical protein